MIKSMLLLTVGVSLGALGCAAPQETKKSTRSRSAPSETVTFSSPKHPSGHTAVDDHVTDVSLHRQQALAHYQVAMRQARKHLAAKRFDEARDSVAIALATLDSRRTVLRTSEYQQLRGRAVSLQGSMDRRR